MSEPLISFEIDGRPLQARRGAMIIEAADAAGIRIPRFCYHQKLSVAANCRMCLVEVEKAPKPVAACAFPVAEGMKVFTRSSKALDAQRGTMEFLLINHPLDCPICDQGGECELQDMAMGYGRDVSRYAERKRVVMDKDLGPLVSTDMTRCIHCTRCVRFGTEIAGLREMGATGRGEFMQIGTFVEQALVSELSGNIIDLCPVGALNAKPSRFAARAWEMSRHMTVAAHDSVGSNIDLHVLRGRVIRAVPHDNEAVNETWISDRDRFSYLSLTHPERLMAPELREGTQWRTLDWETALAETAARLKSVAPEDIGAWVSPHATLEELYLLQKLLRGIGVFSLDHRLRQSDFSDEDIAPATPWLGRPLAELETLDAVLLVGCDIRREQPLAGLRLRKAALRGASIMSANPRDFGFHFPCAEQVVTGADGMLRTLAGIAKALLGARVSTLPMGIRGMFAELRPEPVEECIAERLRGAGQATILLGAVSLAHPQLALLRALASLTADACGARLGYLPPAANSLGADLCGVSPRRLPGGRSPQQQGRHYRGMLEHPPRLLLLWGVEPEFDCENPATAVAAACNADQVIAFSAFASPGLRSYAQVMLPIASAVETAGTFVNAEARRQSFEAVVAPPKEAKPGWKLLRVLGETLGLSGFGHTRIAQVREELTTVLGEWEAPDNRSPWPADSESLPVFSGLQRISSMSLYAGDPWVRRAQALQETPEARGSQALSIHPEQARKLDLHGARHVRLRQGSHAAVLPLTLDEGLPLACVHVYSGSAVAQALGSSFGPVELEAVS